GVGRPGITVCGGGITGMGDTRRDRYGLLQQLSNQRPHPESVPINLLVRVKGTPLHEQRDVDSFETVRMIGTARILMPSSIVRLTAGRLSLSEETQALCYIAGANSIFVGDKFLTTPNPDIDDDRRLFDKLVMSMRHP